MRRDRGFVCFRTFGSKRNRLGDDDVAAIFMDFLAAQAFVDVLWDTKLHANTNGEEFRFGNRTQERTAEEKVTHMQTALEVVMFHRLREVDKYFWGALLPPPANHLFPYWAWLKSILLQSSVGEPWLLESIRLAHDAWQLLTKMRPPLGEITLQEFRGVVAIEAPSKKGAGLPDRAYRQLFAVADLPPLRSLFYRYTQAFHDSRKKNSQASSSFDDGKDGVVWVELFRGWIHCHLSKEERANWPWVLPANRELPPIVFGILFS